MKTFASKQLTNHQELNKYLLSGAQLDDTIYDKDNDEYYSVIEMLAYEYDCKRLSHDTLLFILYDMFQIDKHFDSYSDVVVNQLALLGLETQQILNSNRIRAKKLLVVTNHYLEELAQCEYTNVKVCALVRLDLINQVNHASKQMKLLFDSLTHRECDFYYINDTTCALMIPNSLYWCANESALTFEIKLDDDKYTMFSLIDECFQECFENGIRQGLESLSITYQYNEQEAELHICHEFDGLDKLIEFMTWAGIEISRGAYNIQD